MGTLLIIFNYEDGNFNNGFNQLLIQFYLIGSDGQQDLGLFRTQLPLAPDIPQLYQDWQQGYRGLMRVKQRGFKPIQWTHVSVQEVNNSLDRLYDRFNRWLDSPEFKPAKKSLETTLQTHFQENVLLVIHADNLRGSNAKGALYQLPWRKWDVLRGTENLALVFGAYNLSPSLITSAQNATANIIRTVRIVCIIGDKGGETGLGTQKDIQLIDDLPGAKVDFFIEPKRIDFNRFWDEPLDILFFSGHSWSKQGKDSGLLSINPDDSLDLAEIKKTLKAAKGQGLKIAIFNSCDGLGLAEVLKGIGIPVVVFWSEPVADIVAQRFLEYFLKAFTRGKTLPASIQEARDKLHELDVIDKRFPGVSDLLCISGNPGDLLQLTWSQLGGLPPNPYRGLKSFSEEDKQLFFGRKAFTKKLISAIKEKSLVAIIGPSGSGKSSIVFAGLVPKLKAGIPSLGKVRIASFRPGEDPFMSMAIALAQISDITPEQENNLDILSKADQQRYVKLNLANELGHNPDSFYRAITTIIQQEPGTHLVIIADQFEELYTTCPKEKRFLFLDSLVEVVNRATNFRLVITLRADFCGLALLYQPFGELIQRHRAEFLTQMNHEELKEAIVKPANLMQVSFEGGLVKRLVEAVESSTGKLPLLEFALAKLWEKQQDLKLTHQAYEAIGGVNEALSLYAETKYAGLSEQDRRRLRRILLRLVSWEEGLEVTRRIARRGEINPEDWELVVRLAEDRLFVTDYNDALRTETVEIIHESLINNWATLKQLIEENKDFLHWKKQLQADVSQWQSRNQHSDYLVKGRRLIDAEEMLQGRWQDLSRDERKYIKACRQFDRKKRNTRKVLFSAIVSAIVIFLISIMGFSWQLISIGINESIQVTAESATLNFVSGRQLEAIVGVLDAGFRLKKTFVPITIDTELQVLAALKNTIGQTSRVMEKNQLIKHKYEANEVAFSPDSKFIASASGDGKIILWESSGKCSAVSGTITVVQKSWLVKRI
jgi:energy-coupling factor transporter ATP-binding protein EcfA2